MAATSARSRILLAGISRAALRTGVASFFLLSAGSSLQTAVAEGDTRTLTFHHVHTGEDITVTFKKNGRYDETALEKLNWFMRDWRKDQETKMSPQLFDILWEAYRSVGGSEPIQVICGYRSPETNSMLRNRSESSGVAQTSLHMQGEAMDFYIPGVPLEKVRETGLRMQRGGVGFYPTSGSPFVHLDTGSVRHWPRMTREQLVRVFPDQRTVHVPSDGVPLAGYALALADVEKGGNEPNEVSLTAARSAGVIGDEDRTAGTPKKRSFLASLFGTKDTSDEDAQDAKTPASPKVAAKKPAPVRESVAVAQMPPLPAPPPVQVAIERITPTPKARPVVVAAAEIPPPTPRARPQLAMASNTVEQRGLWPLEVASAEPVLTASLAYATEKSTTPVNRTSTQIASAQPVSDFGLGTKSDRVAFDNRFDGAMQSSTQGPWLRAMILAPNLTTAMTTTTLGPLNAKPLADFIRKPKSSVLMSFADDPHYGMETGKFTGAAVVFLATATFSLRTASLQ